MQQLGFALRVAEARLHAACLEGFEVGAGRNFAVGILRRQPYFDVIGHRGREAHVAAAQFDHAIGQP